ncbi:hypothetical protein ACLOJK_036029 [Asimina triloba]
MAARRSNFQEMEGSDNEEEAGEEIESAPPLKIGEEREIISLPGLKKKLLKKGDGWETPELGDEVTGEVVTGLDHGIVTMKKGEHALFTVPSALGYGIAGGNGVPPKSTIQFEVELISWFRVVDVCKDGGIVKKILSQGERDDLPSELDEVKVRYEAKLEDGTIIAKTPEGGVEFYVQDGHFCRGLPKAVKTMRRGEKIPADAFGEQQKGINDGFPTIPSNSTLEIYLELVSFKPVVDVNGDLSVLKKILKEGETIRSPNEGAVVHVRYTAMLEDGTLFEKKGFDGEGLFEFVVDEGQVIAGLDRTVATMKKGEVSVVTIRPEYGFGGIEVKRDLGTVPANSTIIFEVEMVDFTQEKEPFEMGSNHERIDSAGKKKEEGNRLFKIGKYMQAARRYVKATEYVPEDRFYEDDEQKLVKSVRVSCWLNHAACCLRLNDFREAIKLCSKVLDVESHNVKALYRRAQAYIETADLDLAELDVKKALEVDPQNREVKSMQKTLKQIQVESNKRDAKLFANMFSQMRKESLVEAKVNLLLIGSTYCKKRPKVEKAADEKNEEDLRTMDVEKIAVNAGPTNDEMVVDSC